MSQLITFLSFLLLVTSPSAASVCPPRPPPNQISCTNKPVMTLSDIQYSSSFTFSTPAHLATKYATVSFNLTNTAVPYTTHCTGSSMNWPVFFFGGMIFQCDPPTGLGNGAAANFEFSESDGTFKVNQTWNCWNQGGHKTVKYQGYGTGSVALDCETKTYNNPDWQIGEIYSSESKTCKPGKLSITPKVIKV